MGARIVIEHNSAGWAEIFKSEGMKAVVDAAGERIARAPAERLLCAGRASPRPAQLLAFAPGKEQAAGVWEP